MGFGFNFVIISVGCLYGMTEGANPAPDCEPLSSSTMLVHFNETSDADLYYVQLATPGSEDSPFALVTATSSPVSVEGLSPNATYAVSMRAHDAATPSIAWGPSWGEPSESAVCTTLPSQGRERLVLPSTSGADSNSSFLRVYRISEYSFDVDFLENHDAASADAMPLYMMTCDPTGLCTPWSVDDMTPRWDSCQEALASICPDQRGGSFACLDCMTAATEAVTEACGEWYAQDTLNGEGSYPVHWYCGVGWPESTPAQGPITEYCVEYLPLPPAEEEPSPTRGGGAAAAVVVSSIGDGGGGGGGTDDGFNDDAGFATYLSCNSDEVDAFGNDPRGEQHLSPDASPSAPSKPPFLFGCIIF